MSPSIDPRVFQKDEDPRGWESSYPTWLSSKNELKTNMYLVPDHLHSVSLINNDPAICIGNVCPHKQSIILENSAIVNNIITCPIHRWTWDKTGTFKNGRGISPTCNVNLPLHPLYDWEGHYFIGSKNWMKDISKLDDLTQYLNINGYTYHSSHKLEYNFDWKIFFEIFLDLYHVKPYHPGLRSLTDCNTFDWKFGDHWSCQTALFNRNMPTEENYLKLYEIYKRSGHFDTAKYGAVWLGVYPNTMLEYYPGCFVTSTIWPNGKGKCVNYLKFYYEQNLLDNEPTFPEIQKKSFMVTADEDEIIGNKISEGRKFLTKNLKFINHPTEEKGTEHYYNWLESNTKFLTC